MLWTRERGLRLPFLGHGKSCCHLSPSLHHPSPEPKSHHGSENSRRIIVPEKFGKLVIGANALSAKLHAKADEIAKRL